MSEATKAFIGVDPGAAGAIALIQADGRTVVAIENLPLLPEGILDARALHRMLCSLCESSGLANAALVATIERIIALPDKSSPFALTKLAESAGAARGVLCALGAEILMPTPAVWKKRLGLARGTKQDSKQLAMQLFGNLPSRLRTDKAEALLLAYYGRVFSDPLAIQGNTRGRSPAARKSSRWTELPPQAKVAGSAQ